MDFKDYYQVLGVPRTATAREIKSAYRKMARKYHPDVNPGDAEAEKRFREINEAHEVLGDEENRKKYDQLGARWKQGAAPGWPPGGGQGVEFDLGDLFAQMGGAGSTGRSSFFDMFFGGMGGAGGFPGGGRSTSRPGSDVEANVEISLEEAFHGTTRQLTLEKTSVCPTCAGRGRMDTAPCRTCHGRGQTSAARVLEVRIPAGVTDGSRVRVRGEGQAGAGGGPSGDVYLQVHLRSHPLFDVKGRDVHRELRVPLYDAVLGGEVSFPGPNGSTLTLKIPPETQGGSQLRLTGQGLPRARGQAGDLYVRLQIELPTNLTEKERSLFRQLAELRAHPHAES
jgi:DnaJ-class molecular chaperone